jgi:hypothetical protein
MDGVEVFGVFVVKNQSGYTGPANEQAKNSLFEILLTDIKSLPTDLSNYKFHKLQKTGDKKIINRMQRDMSKVKKDMSGLREEVKRLERDRCCDILIMLIVGVIIGSFIGPFITFLLSK